MKKSKYKMVIPAKNYNEFEKFLKEIGEEFGISNISFENHGPSFRTYTFEFYKNSERKNILDAKQEELLD